jgi:hypothetical protein
MGRTTLQYEFALGELAGVEVRRDYRFGFADVIIGIVLCSLISSIFSKISGNIYAKDIDGGIAFALLLGIAGMIPTFVVHKKFFLKLLLCSVGTGCLMGIAIPSISTIAIQSLINSIFGGYGGGYGMYGQQNNTLIIILFLLSYLVEFAALLLFSFKPNLVIVFKTKGAAGAVEIRRKTRKDEYTGYQDVMPVEDTEKAIREIGAMITDFNAIGDYGIDIWFKKWAEQGSKKQLK